MPPSPARNRLQSLTGLRIFGSVAVVICHLGNGFAADPSLNVAETYGYVGVTFFFMLSGFVLAWSCAGQPAVPFWWKRLTRIWPLQFVMMVFAYTAIPAHERVPGLPGQVAQLFLVQAWFPDRQIYAGGNGVTWSLSVEMFFYLMFPAAMVLVGRLRRRGLAIAAGLTLAALVALPAAASLAGLSASGSLYYWLFFVFPPYRFGEFLLGMLLARAMTLGLRLPAPGVLCLIVTADIAAVFWVLALFTVHTGAVVARPFAALLLMPFFALLLCGCATRDLGGRRWWLSSAPAVRLGEWSFALYLIHSALMYVTAPLGWWDNPGGLWGLADFLAFLALALVIAAALHYLVERPAERRLRRAVTVAQVTVAQRLNHSTL